jgi:hypothetical protein
MVLTVTAIIYSNSINQLIFVMVKCGVLFQVRTEFLNSIQTSFGFKGLIAEFQIYDAGQTGIILTLQTCEYVPKLTVSNLGLVTGYVGSLMTFLSLCRLISHPFISLPTQATFMIAFVSHSTVYNLSSCSP